MEFAFFLYHCLPDFAGKHIRKRFIRNLTIYSTSCSRCLCTSYCWAIAIASNVLEIVHVHHIISFETTCVQPNKKKTITLFCRGTVAMYTVICVRVCANRIVRVGHNRSLAIHVVRPASQQLTSHSHIMMQCSELL